MSDKSYIAHTRLFVDKPLSHGAIVELDDEQRHYIVNVMRFKLGSKLRVFNGVDGEWQASLSHVAKKTASIEIGEQTKEQTNLPDVWYVFAPIKKARLDFIVQKATELGATAIVPVFTKHTVAQRVNEKRMMANAVEAAEQSERLCVPKVFAPQKLDKFLTSLGDDGARQLLFCDESLTGKPAIEELAATKKDNPWAVLVGPEGGFDSSEREMIKNYKHVTAVSLGPRILRADTAGMAALTLWQASIGDW